MAEINAFSTAGPASRQLYQDLLAALRSFGPFHEEIKKTSVHLVRNVAFVGVHPRKQHLLLIIKVNELLWDRRILKSEQMSHNHWHLETKLSSAQEIDEQLLAWARNAYDLCA